MTWGKLVEMYCSRYMRRLPGVPLNRWLVSHGGRGEMEADNVLKVAELGLDSIHVLVSLEREKQLAHEWFHLICPGY